MKKLLVVSDTHGMVDRLRRVILQESDADALIFLGDGSRDMDAVRQDFHGPVYRVRGNCDHTSQDPAEGLAAFDRVLLFYTHGQNYGVKTGYSEIQQAAQNRSADLALFGHTHYPLNRCAPGCVGLFNPGSLGFGAQYGIIICDNGSFVCQNKEMKSDE